MHIKRHPESIAKRLKMLEALQEAQRIEVRNRDFGEGNAGIKALSRPSPSLSRAATRLEKEGAKRRR